MLLALLQFIAGSLLLIWSANKMILGASELAKHWGLSPLFIGVTIVALGTSAPEIFISIMAAIENTPHIAIGSNIANIGLVLGACLLIKPLTFPHKLLKMEFPILLLVSCVVTTLLWDRMFLWGEGLICFVLLILFLSYYTYRQRTQEYKFDDKIKLSLQKSFFWTILGFILLPISSDLLILSAEKIALFFGISKLVIGLTLIALGTSLPELAASLVSTVQGKHDIAIGNILGKRVHASLSNWRVPAPIISALCVTTD